MVRMLVTVAVLYGCGDPRMDGYRPRAFDGTLRSFHREVDAVVSGTRRALGVIDDMRSMRRLNVLIDRL